MLVPLRERDLEENTDIGMSDFTQHSQKLHTLIWRRRRNVIRSDLICEVCGPVVIIEDKAVLTCLNLYYIPTRLRPDEVQTSPCMTWKYGLSIW